MNEKWGDWEQSEPSIKASTQGAGRSNYRWLLPPKTINKVLSKANELTKF